MQSFYNGLVESQQLATNWIDNTVAAYVEDAALDTYMPEPSAKPTGAPLPPVSLEEKLRTAKQFYVKQKDVDPAQEGLGWTPGCKGCESIAGGHATQLAHSDECRLRVIEKTKSNPVTAARIQMSEARVR